MTERRKLEEYDKAMEDPAYRAAMERTAPFTAQEEAELYDLLDELADAQEDAALYDLLDVLADAQEVAGPDPE